MNDLPDDQWRPVSMRPEGVVWIACDYQDGRKDVFAATIWPRTDWPTSKNVVAWKPYKTPTFSDYHRKSVQKLENKLNLKNAYVSIQDVLDTIDEHLGKHTYPNVYSLHLLKDAVLELDTVKMQ